jgi:hypothetical protein
MVRGREFHNVGAEWKKDRLAIAALTTEGRFRETVVDEQVLYAFDCTVSNSAK